MQLTYRMATPDDHPALIRLWSEDGGWDRLEAEAWSDRLLRTPVGPSSFAVAEDPQTGELVGQFAFIPSMVAVDGDLFPAVRPFAPILLRSVRGRILSIDPRKSPVSAMYRLGIQELSARGPRVAYMIADPHWVLMMKFNPNLKLHKFPLWSLPLPLSRPLPLGAGFDAAPLGPWDDRVDALWQAASRLHGCLVLRDTRALPWKVGRGDYEILCVERRGELVGLVASRCRGDAQWLLCDVLSADLGPSLRATLVAACNLAHAREPAPGEPPLRKVAVLATPALEPALRELGFARDRYDFPLVMQRIDGSIEAARVDPARWYVSAND
jgi:hypothetical protein